MQDNIHANGRFTIEVIRDTGNGPKVIHREVVKNRVLNTGKKQTWRQAAGLNAKIWDTCRIGTSGATTNSGQTNVLSPVTGTIVTADSITMDGRTLQLVVSYPSGGGSKSAASIQEVCILNQATSPGGSALCRALFTAASKTEDDKLKITYEVRIT